MWIIAAKIILCFLGWIGTGCAVEGSTKTGYMRCRHALLLFASFGLILGGAFLRN